MTDKKRILVVDDEVGFTQLLKLNLEKTGAYEVLEENRGVFAVAAAKKFKPDLILLDIIMPDIDGGQVAAQIKTREEMKDTPILFLTAIVSKNEMTYKDGRIGGYPFLAKPIDTDEIIASIEHMLA